MPVQYYPEAITNIVAGILVIAFGILVGNILAVLSKKILQAFEVERIMQSQGMGFPYESFVSSIIRYATYAAGLVWGLTFLGLEMIILRIILWGLLLALTLFILLSLKDFIPNFVGGIILNMSKKVKRGEKIKIEGAEGKVLHVNLLETKLKMSDGDEVIIPNILLVRSKVVKRK